MNSATPSQIQTIQTNGVILDFLIILKSRDFNSKICCTMYKKIKHATKKLPGVIHICSIDDIKTYNIKGLILPYVLYIKLPKENIYISSDEWEAEYFNSQTFELIKIFNYLGASDIKFKTMQNHADVNSINVHANANLNMVNLPVKVNGDLENFEETDDANAFDGQIKTKIPKMEKYCSVDDFIEKANLYYAKNNYEWKALIGHKLTNESTMKIKFSTIFYRGFQCGTKVATNLEALGISVSLFTSGSKYVKIIFEVLFDANNDNKFKFDKSNDDNSKDESSSMNI